ncbi:MAG TPA: hypothetical protein PK916_04645 [Bacteroidota bacterium]|nr:hypothetical protein [Bacteroidota bacterium]
MPNPSTKFLAEYGGRRYALHLRTSDDGYITAYERAAVDLLLEPFLARPTLSIQEIMVSETRTSGVLNLILTEGARGGMDIKDRHGDITFEPLPWAFWYELDADLIVHILHSFFFFVARKIERLRTSERSIAGIVPEVFSAFVQSMNTEEYFSTSAEGT